MPSSWQFEQSFITIANRDIAWRYWSDIANHAEMEGVTIELDGPFRTGTKGRTISSNFRQEWELSEVISKRRFVITGRDGEFALSFAWRFDDEGTGTRMTQRIRAEGPQATMEQWGDALRQMESTAPQNLKRLAERLDGLSH